MGIATDLSRVKSNITAALAAIAEKGVTVPDGSNSDALAELIASIQAGEGCSKFATGSFTTDSDQTSVRVEHGLGEIPNVYIVLTYDIDGTQTVLTNKFLFLFCDDINNIDTYFSASDRVGSNSTHDNAAVGTNGRVLVTDTYRNTSGVIVSESKVSSCKFSNAFGSTTKAYFHAGYTYKYLIGRVLTT